MANIRNCVIIGTGPSGLTAAIYTSRANLNPLIIAGLQPGGQLTTTTEVENFPGFPEGISGPELMENMRKQAARFNTEFKDGRVVNADLSKKPFTITLESGETILTKTVIISTGASAKYMGLKNEQALIGKGVSACATCDGFFYRNKIVHVVGGGDTALEEAGFLSKFASKVYILHRRGELRASKAMQDHALKNPKIEVIWNSVPIELLSDNSGLTAVKIQNVLTGEESIRKTDGFFLGIGHTPNTHFLGKQIELDQQGFIKTHNDVETNIEGVFACGDVQDPTYRQAISAAGSGCQAAIRAERFLAEHS